MSADNFKLIDLSGEEEELLFQCSPSKPAAPMVPMIPEVLLVTGRESLENNPFDVIQKQAQLENDPFEICYTNAKKLSTESHPREAMSVLEGNLLSLEENEPAAKTTNNDITQRERIHSDPEVVRKQHPKLTDIKKSRSSSLDLLKYSLCSKSMENLMGTPEGKVGQQGWSDICNDSCEDLSSVIPNLVDSGSDFDVDLESFKMPSIVNSKQIRPLETENKELSFVVEKSVVHQNVESIDQKLEEVKEDVRRREQKIEELRKITLRQKETELKYLNLLKEDKEREMLTIKKKEQEEESVLLNINNEERAQELNSTQTKELPQKPQDTKEFDALLLNLQRTVQVFDDPTKKLEAEQLLQKLNNIYNKKITLKSDVSEVFKEEDKPADFSQENEKILIDPPNPIKRQGTFDIDLENNNEDSIHSDCNDAEHCLEVMNVESTSISPIEKTAPSSLPSSSESLQVQAFDAVQDDPELNSVIEELQRVLGKSESPTYIVVVKGQKPDHQSSLDHQRSIEPTQIASVSPRMRTYRSKSLSSHDKKLSISRVIASPQNARTSITANAAITKLKPTPPSNITRRSSFSTPPATPVKRATTQLTARPGHVGLKTPQMKQPAVPLTRLQVRVRSDQKPTTATQSRPTGPLKAFEMPQISSQYSRTNQMTLRSNVVPSIHTSTPKSGGASSTTVVAPSTPKSVKPRTSYLSATPTANKTSYGDSVRRRTLSEYRPEVVVAVADKPRNMLNANSTAASAAAKRPSQIPPSTPTGIKKTTTVRRSVSSGSASTVRSARLSFAKENRAPNKF